MYTRYIPQPDGSYRRSRIPDSKPHTQAPRADSASPPKQGCPYRHEHPPKTEPAGDAHIGSFLRKLLPDDFDTSDLLIVLLLLLMAGDSDEDKNTALLTLIIYLFQ